MMGYANNATGWFRNVDAVRQTGRMALCLIAFWIFGATAFGQESLYSAVEALKTGSDSAGWKRLQKPLAELRENLEKQAEHLPYEFPAQPASLDLLNSLADAKPGTHSLWLQFRIASMTPPPSGGYINQCAAVIRGDLRADETSPASLRKPKSYRQRWEGYIHSSVVIVDGAIDMDGYIANSIVICSGPIKLYSYISNSLVVSCYTGDEFSVDTRDGYISHSIVAAKKCRPGSARSCVIFGDLDGTDLRAADSKSWYLVSKQIEALGAPAREFPSGAIAPKGPTVAQKLAALLATEDQIEAAMLAEQLSDAILTKEQVNSLIENATSTTSDARRNAIWHTIRLSRDIAGQQYLRDTLAKSASPEQKIRFIQSIKNPTIDDVPLLTDIYSSTTGSEAASKPNEELDNVREQVLRVATLEWKRMVVDSSRDPELDAAQSAKQREIYDRRQDRALEGQSSMLRWLVRHGATDEHRLQAFSVVGKLLSWPNEWKLREETRIDEDLWASSQDPAFRVKLLEKFGASLPVGKFLDPAGGEVDAVRLASIRAIRRAIEAERNATRGYSGQYDDLLKRVAELDETANIRDAAKQLLEEIRLRSRRQ